MRKYGIFKISVANPNLFIKYLGFISLFIFAISSKVDAKHIIGGDMSYRCISSTDTEVTLRVQLILYRDQRDPEGAQCDLDAEFGIWRGSTGDWRFVRKTTPLAPQQATVPELENPPCADAGSGTAGIQPNEQCIYTFDVTLTKISDNYLIGYQRCCRNEAIINVIRPGSFGAVFEIEITPEALNSCNSSPKFNEYKTSIFCTNQDLVIDNNAPDTEGDSVVYRFCIPVSGGGENPRDPNSCTFVKPNPELCPPSVWREVIFRSNMFSYDNPILGVNKITLDSTTGLLELIPNITGEFVLAICAEEYRNGVLLTKLRRDLQVIITTCTPKDALLSLDPEDAANGLNVDENGVIEQDSVDNIQILRTCGDTEIKFDLHNVSVPYRTETFQWFFDLGNNNILSSDERQPVVNFPGIGVYDGFLVIDPASPPCSDTAFVQVRILATVRSDFDIDYDQCIAQNIQFEDLSSIVPTNGGNSITSWNWNFGDGSTSTLINPTHFYTEPGTYDVSLTIGDDNGCQNVQTRPIDWFPVPSPEINPDKIWGCTPQSILFSNVSQPIDEINYSFEWDFGDGSNGSNRYELNPEHVYEESGTFDISLKITSNSSGCSEERKFKELITIVDGFESDFEFAPTPGRVGESFGIDNQSDAGAVNYAWNFNDNEYSTSANPTFAVRDTGAHFVQLVSQWPNGCSDEITKEFHIAPCVDLQYPNAFTPNNDGKNEEFKGVVFGVVPSDFSMTVFDRWGKIIFETDDPYQGWNGKFKNEGNHLPAGVYLFKVQYSNPSCDTEIKPGFATLIR